MLVPAEEGRYGETNEDDFARAVKRHRVPEGNELACTEMAVICRANGNCKECYRFSLGRSKPWNSAAIGADETVFYENNSCGMSCALFLSLAKPSQLFRWPTRQKIYLQSGYIHVDACYSLRWRDKFLKPSAVHSHVCSLEKKKKKSNLSGEYMHVPLNNSTDTCLCKKGTSMLVWGNKQCR